MANAKPNRSPQGKKPQSNNAQGRNPQNRSQNPTGKARVAAARQSGISRTTWLLGGLALIVVVAIVITAVVLGSSKSEESLTGHGTAPLSTATLTGDAIVVSVGTPAKTVDIYEDTICPICGQFEQASGAEIGAAINSGAIAVNYRPLDFLNAASSSGDYSTRATAAMMCVADKSGSVPGVFSNFHGLLFSPDFQPEESGSSDHTNQELADAATANGAQSAASCISGGEMLAQAAALTQSSSATLNSVTGRVSSPSVIYQGQAVNWQQTGWMTALLSQA